ncbi:hypothetical protein PoB_005420700 [Plakobranchus ocellatus]|uniref:Uncharacterized protein n=1 Tax=Plakobranchus ocellatus TaxID=259542 RepID=A0AAV4C852_9GAST|nr:hypothetical protein PoB_005420700 [Plakobranchus ocellatus]
MRGPPSSPMKSKTLKMCLYRVRSSPFSNWHGKKSYSIHQLQAHDFWDFKKLSQDLKIPSVRRDSQDNEPVNGMNIMDVKITKDYPSTIFFKTSHLDATTDL